MKALYMLLAAALPTTAADQPRRYKEGQVWAYKTRSGDEGSLLKIQHIEQLGNETVYHISVIGFHFHTPGIVSILPHEPVSRTTLDASVTELRPDPGTFPSADEGIAQWRGDHGGVYTITVAQTLDVADQTLSAQRPAP